MREAAGRLPSKDSVSGPGPVRPGENRRGNPDPRTSFQSRRPLTVRFEAILAMPTRGPAAARRLRNLPPLSSINPFNQALIFAGLGDKDRTFEALDRVAAVGLFAWAGRSHCRNWLCFAAIRE